MESDTPRSRLLTETDWLADHLSDPSLRIVDIRGIIRPPDAPHPHYFGNRSAYLEGHIPGAVFVDWTADITEPGAPVKMTLAGPERFAALMGRQGIGDEHTVVVYEDSAGHIAARLWWALNYYGHPAVKLLNGGFPKWIAEGRSVTATLPHNPPAVFTPKVQPNWRVGSAEVRAAIGDPGAVLVDLRSPTEFHGEIGRGDRKGRIPGACNVPMATLVSGEYKTLNSEGNLRHAFEGAGVTFDKRAITYCNAGVAAALGLFALKLIGHPGAANFAGSWYEWERDPQNPTETG
ncbi:MAG TPA: sulfurtransferase [Candidatus Methylomirabilis sp.]|nr:sulfurtransferase [Candidatus Methylomirabilis sp.]